MKFFTCSATKRQMSLVFWVTIVRDSLTQREFKPHLVPLNFLNSLHIKYLDIYTPSTKYPNLAVLDGGSVVA